MAALTLTAFGRTQTVPEWADELDMNAGTIRWRMRNKTNWTAEQILTREPRSMVRRRSMDVAQYVDYVQSLADGDTAPTMAQYNEDRPDHLLSAYRLTKRLGTTWAQFLREHCELEPRCSWDKRERLCLCGRAVVHPETDERPEMCGRCFREYRELMGA